MNTRRLLAIMSLLLVVAVIAFGTDMAYAGPGGGTYYANSPAGGTSGTALRKFVDTLPGIGPANANNLGQYIPVATPDTTTYPGSDYYKLEVVEYTEKLHSDLPKATRLRGYRDVGGNQPAHYLGPLIIAKRDRAVRILFKNSLPTGAAGNLFIPVDTALMGAGAGPKGITKIMITNGGSNYSIPTVTFTGGGATVAATGTVTVTNGVVTGVTIVSGGSGYTTPPTVTISGGGGAGATATATILAAGAVNTVTITNGGAGYSAPSVAFTGGGATTNAAGDVLVTNGVVTGINLTNPGVGYTSAPTITISGGGGNGATATATVVATAGNFSQNRATLHLHGGNSPWISDGTPHQWTVPAGEVTLYKKGVSTRDVPDMPATGDGEMTFYWTNQQSARFMFYHDHSYGITRLNVYAGEAAGYLIWSQVEEDLISGTNVAGANPGNRKLLPDLGGVYHYGIPLVIQDKTFVPQNIDVQDAYWTKNMAGVVRSPAWGTYGDLWFPHVYEPNQDPLSPGGANPFGRWDYGPWFWPPVPVDAAHSTLPDPTTTPEAFADTPIVNGTAYPYLTVAPKPYRFRILNACNDRALNLSLFYVDPLDPSGKEVPMLPAGPNPLFPPTWPTDGRAGGVPDPAYVGPNWIQIGNESGFLPNPVVIPAQPINYDYNRRNIVVLDILDRALYLAPAERADVIVDFSTVPTGSKIILYNDAPAPAPAFDPRYDYFTGNPDQTLGGGAPSTLRGYGPNTRTIMQFVVSGPKGAAVDLAGLQTAIPAAFKADQPVPIIPETNFNAAYGTTYTNDMLAKIQQYSFDSFVPINGTVPTTIPFQTKAIQELWDAYGRMNATLGVEKPFTNNNVQTTIPLGYIDPPTEFLTDGQAQIWKITHNGVDTHPVHFHLMDVQLINRVGWDGAIRLPAENERGWKETVRMNPLEDAIVAVRPKTQTLPFALPTSQRALDVTTALGENISVITDPFGTGNVVTVPNAMQDFGHEYVWHCHILGHEENDFMRAVVFNVPSVKPNAPTGLSATSGTPGINQVTLTWTQGAVATDNSNLEGGYRVERAQGGGGYTALGTITFIPGYPLTYTDSSVMPNTQYSYRVVAFNSIGSTNSAAATVTTGAWSGATGLTITPDKPTPHIVGSQVQFTATGSGASATAVYQYRFYLNSGAGNVLVQDYSLDNSWQLPDTTPVGNYTITVHVRTTASTTPEVIQSMAYQIVPPPFPPVTTSFPVPGIYTSAPVVVTLTTSTLAPPAKIFYTLDGTIPTTASTLYTVPITLTATTTINYFAQDANGVAETIKTDTWVIHAADLVASVLINNGAAATNNTAVTLTLNAVDPAGVATMQFSNDNVTYTAEEPYFTTKAWTLSAGEGLKTVYVRFRDKSLPTGNLYAPVTASITYTTAPPVTTASPITGTYAAAPVAVTLTTNVPATIYYTIDGTVPTATSSVYIAPIYLAATTTIKYFAVDVAGNIEAVNSGTWTIHTADMVASMLINNGAPSTNNSSVTLTLSAVDPQGIATMQFSNDGVTYSAEEAYATTKAWTLSAGDGTKTVYVRFRDKTLPTGFLYDPITASIKLVTAAPITTATPIPGTYSVTPVPVILTTTTSGLPATIYYTIDGTAPTTASSVYTTPIMVTATTTINYFAVDQAGNIEIVKTGTWVVHTGDLVASVSINNGAVLTNSTAVTLTLNAIDPLGVKTMQFSNDGTNYTAEEPYATTKLWNVDPGDGLKTVYVRFRDNSLPYGNLYNAFAANITLDTTLPITTANPITGTYSSAMVPVALTANEPATIYYTTNGTTPTTTSAIYTGPIIVAATTTIQYFAVDLAGNVEAVKSGTWTMHVSDLVASVKINNGATHTNNPSVTLTLNAFDPVGVATMQFSNDGVNFTAEEPYATTRTWGLAPGDGIKTVYVQFRDATLPTGNLYAPVSASITLSTKAPVTSVSPVPGIYSKAPVLVSLVTDVPANIYYTIDGSTPTTASAVYTAPISVSATTTIKYFSIDVAGNAEIVKSGTWTIHVPDMIASVTIGNGGPEINTTNVTLTLIATDPAGVSTMQFSNDGISYTAEELYQSTKKWTLTQGDGQKTVYVRLRDGALPTGNLYSPITATVMLDTVNPVTTASPIPATYAGSVSVTLTANEPTTIYYTINGPDPTTSSKVYTGPITVKSTSTIKYFSVDAAGNAEAVQSGTWTVHVSDMVASVKINNGAASTNSTAVTLTLNATDPLGVATMQFSNDGFNYTPEEAYATTKAWTIDSGDGVKTVYVKFRDKALPTGNLYDPVTATITLDTAGPVTTATPVPGEYSGGPLSVTLATSTDATIYYTTDGSTPTTASPAYSAAIPISATTTINYYAVDSAGNAETVKSGTWKIDISDLVASISINSGAPTTSNPDVILTLSAVDPEGVSTMQFSNDGINFTDEEAYATTKAWTLDPNDGLKTVYVKFRDKTLPAGNLYPPVTSSIMLKVTIPDAPLKLAAAASAAGLDQPKVVLTWTDSSNNETGFVLQRATSPAFGKKGVTILKVGANATSFIDDTVLPKTKYFYRLQSINSAGASKYSNVVSVKTTGQIPVAPSDLLFVSSTKNSCTISWTDNSTNEKGFYIESSLDGAKWKRAGKVAAGVTTYTQKGLKKNKTYWYRVQSFNAGGVSSYSNSVSGSTTQ